MLFAGTISPTICLGDGPIEGRQEKTRRKASKKKKEKRKEKKRAAAQSSKNQSSIFMSSWWDKDDTRDPREGRDGGAKTGRTIIKIKQKLTKNQTNSTMR